MRTGFGLALLLWALILGVVFLLSGCAHVSEAPPTVVYKEAKVAVSAGCVVDRPEPVKPMNQQVSKEQWDALAPGAKAQAVKAQIGERLNYEDNLRASTSGCPDAKK